MNEKITRKQLIDQRLMQAGWHLEDRTLVVEELYLATTNEYVDYVLYAKDGKPFAVIEAKKTSKDAELGREQAKQYCQNIQQSFNCELPFCFYTNGNDIYFWDIGKHPPRKIHSFPERQDLERLRHIHIYKKPLAHEFINTSIAGRDYQVSAIRSIMEAIDKKRRNFLLVMATGTGKTRTTIALVDALMRAGYVKRTLFLVDRIALREQALDDFKEYLPNEPIWPKFGEKAIAKDRRIYVSTYPSMLNVIRDEEQTLSSHFFDLIIVDESHRSIYNTYGEIFDYFDAMRLGLTATPTNVIDHNTFQLFDCSDGLPTFAFSYEEALLHEPPYLCNFQVMKIKTKFQDEGISKRTISLEDQKRLILEGKEIEEINFEGSDLEKRVINKGTNQLIVKTFMDESIKDNDGVLPAKTIFFCMTKAHARRIEELFDELYPEYAGELAKVMVSDDSRVYGKGGLLDQFKNKNLPRVAISVGMLDTGVDVRELTNLVFAKPVYSYTRFWQMIGRGTRLLEPTKPKAWCTKKDHFLIMDCWDNFEYFKLTPTGKDPTSSVPLPVKLCEIRINKISVALDTAPEISEKEITKLKNEIAHLPEGSIVIRDARNDLDQLDEIFWNNLDEAKIAYLHDKIQPLFKTMVGVDFKAMRFEKDVLDASLSKLANDETNYKKQTDSLIAQISELPLSINIVAHHEDVINEVLKPYFWEHAIDEQFDGVSEELAPLMKYREVIDDGQQTRLNIKDIIKEIEYVEFGASTESVSISQYKAMVEQKISELLAQNPILQKLKEKGTISENETRELAIVLEHESPHITIDLLRRVYQNKKAPFLKLIRHILGIEMLESFPDTVSASIDKFILQHTTLSKKQLEFLNLLRDFLIKQGDIQKKDFISAPFTVLHPDGIRGIFSPQEINEILDMTKELVA
ncbi:DEAD/DEAH box helicase family protein [Sulfuricurvum sp.]|uniref:type I restriction endonuclease subunit R n=1 Tax=Sulfuricurvum sp. TaxID=2025608 RepID=UPI002734B633|nr:type I restriction endonuclease subunit R [Sulfuricurvum sp.]